jgi:catalase-peroxidase
MVLTGNGADTVTSGLEGAWSSNPVAWSTSYLDNLFAFDPSKRHAPIMFTTDRALKEDPGYRKIAKRFRRTRRSSGWRSPRRGSS